MKQSEYGNLNRKGSHADGKLKKPHNNSRSGGVDKLADRQKSVFKKFISGYFYSVAGGFSFRKLFSKAHFLRSHKFSK